MGAWADFVGLCLGISNFRITGAHDSDSQVHMIPPTLCVSSYLQLDHSRDCVPLYMPALSTKYSKLESGCYGFFVLCFLATYNIAASL